jgi:hypothetical protein
MEHKEIYVARDGRMNGKKRRTVGNTKHKMIFLKEKRKKKIGQRI